MSDMRAAARLSCWRRTVPADGAPSSGVDASPAAPAAVLLGPASG